MLGIGIGLTSEGALRRAAGGTWTPLDLGASLKAWWNADDHGTANMTDDGAGLISSWKDRTSAVNATGTTTARPTWAATSFNSAYAGLTFATTTVLATTTLTGLPGASTAGEIWLLVSNVSAGAGNTVPFSYSSTSGGNARSIMRTFPGSVNRATLYDGGVATTDTNAIWTGPAIIGGFWAGTAQDGRVNGSPWSAAGVIPTINTTLGKLTIGARSLTTPDSYFAGVIRHGFVTLTLTALQRQQMEGWLAWDTALTSLLPGGHPYKLVRP